MDRSFAPTEWKPEASAGKHTQADLPLIGLVPRSQLLEIALIERATFNGTLNEAVRHSGKEDQQIADEIHISAGYMSRFMRGVCQQWAKRLVAFMRVTNSLAPLQWMAHQMGCEVVVCSEFARELAATRARLAQLERLERTAA